MAKTQDVTKIRELNDRFRSTFQGGRVMMTQGVNQLAPETGGKVIAAVRGFNTFAKGNDPYCEHDFGAVTVDGDKFFWKIDYYDLAMSKHSADPSDPEAAIRVLTIMCADEY